MQALLQLTKDQEWKQEQLQKHMYLQDDFAK